MPRLTTPTTAMIRRASHLPETSPMRQAARAELAAIRAACPTVAALYAALRCGERHARRLLADDGPDRRRLGAGYAVGARVHGLHGAARACGDGDDGGGDMIDELTKTCRLSALHFYVKPSHVCEYETEWTDGRNEDAIAVSDAVVELAEHTEALLRATVGGELAEMRAERDEWKRATLRWHDWALELCQPPHEHWPMREQISEALTTARQERDALQCHFDAAAPEHNLPALLDLYFERQQRAEKERDEAREMLADVVPLLHGEYDDEIAMSVRITAFLRGSRG